MKNSRTKNLTTEGMLCALAYIAVAVGRIPVVLFLKYDPKDVVIVIGGLIFGPLTSLAMAVIVSVVEMVTISSTGVWGRVRLHFSTKGATLGPALWQLLPAGWRARLR